MLVVLVRREAGRDIHRISFDKTLFGAAANIDSHHAPRRPRHAWR
ncbi:hypothetical protein PATSB16_19100 [Pandoraea thiooxydans]|nr:hypothetical protein PATSB16_19100 [Pandoraea thiooxydans]